MFGIAKLVSLYLVLVATKVCAFQDISKIPASFGRRRTRSISTSTTVYESYSNERGDENLDARRSFLGKIALIPFATLTAMPTITRASGGATAGGAYLLSAKKRYYERVKTSVARLLQVEDGLKNGDSTVAKEFFSSDADGSWKDLTAAGYLLSNAFRRSSSTAPDSLPAVKKYKAFAKEVDNFQKVLKKKGVTAASDEFSSVEVALDEWLSEIELPAAREL